MPEAGERSPGRLYLLYEPPQIHGLGEARQAFNVLPRSGPAGETAAVVAPGPEAIAKVTEHLAPSRRRH
ncbi:hypothetical protein AB0F17_65195 [Nonomuraea sp. NPDC026600]|uniref:hypothetical protein n=1 Tax=Nonomuraea sp. NPDC026600 TaxID=3155363 RepID=UPI00340B5F6F